VRKSPAEKDGTVLKTQALPFQQNESYGLHRADTQILLPRLDVEGGGKMTWTVRLSEAGGNKTKVLALPPEVIVVAQEGHQLGRPLGGGKSHQKSAFPYQTGMEQINRPVLKNAQNLEKVPRRWVSPAIGPLVKNVAHQSLDEWVIPNPDTIDRCHRHGKGGPVDSYGAPRVATIVEVSEVVQNTPQRRLIERNGGRAEEGLERLPSPLIAVL
jgi:hypothetical protein